MDRKSHRILCATLLFSFLHISYGCGMEDVQLWALPVQETILDTFNGIVIRRNTWDIEAITDIRYGPAIISPPYFDISLENSIFIIQTSDAFVNYEEVEVASRIAITVNFRCTGGEINNLVFWIDVTDTNNNPPRFMSDSGEFEFVVAPPLPPGHLVTGCLSDITVRDIDLTTERIDFTIENNPYFEIEYDEAASTVAKEFKARLRTTTFIRSLTEPVELRITATDVDRTNDPPLSAYATVRIVVDTEFQFPEEPIFGQTFYLAKYTEDHQLNLFETISLQQGFDEYVNFTLEGEFKTYFSLGTNGNQVTIEVVNPLPNDVLLMKQIFLIVRANREFMSGGSATVIVQLPEEVPLRFERVVYEGTIVNNSLQLAPLVLSQGYEGVEVSADVIGDYSTYFTATVQGNQVLLTMSPLSDIIDNNNFISLQVEAASNRSKTITVVNLEIIKDDNVTPVFDKSIYRGIYDADTGLNADQISFVQGFDETVTVDLYGEYANYFQINQNGSIITVSSSTIPPEMYSLQNILISIVARKPRTVGANAAINIALPAARELEFEENAYRGTIESNFLTLETILLRNGYEEGVRFDLSGEYASFFTATNTQDRVTIVLLNPLPESAITQNRVIMLTLTASGFNAVTTTTNVFLHVIKEDITTPIFSQTIYYGTYSAAAIEIGGINLAQGFDADVSFRLEGAHAQYFGISNNGNNAVITLQSAIPEDVIYNEKVLLFNVFADKALTVGANAAILIRFPTELTDPAVMQFSQITYVGTLEENEITLENIVLETGFANGTEFLLSGDYYEHFSLSYTNNVVQISRLPSFPNEIVEENDFIVLEVEARRPRAVSTWASVVLRIIRPEVIAPVFAKAYYTGVYTALSGLTFEESISLSQGFDETVTFDLIGESSTWFRLAQENDTLRLVSNTSVPEEILENNNQLLFTVLATKADSADGLTVISIDLPKDFTASSFRFTQDYYKGNIEDGHLYLDEIILEDYTNDVNYTFAGDYADYFQLTNRAGTFTLQLESPLPVDVLEEADVFIFVINVQNRNIRTHTVVLLENIREKNENLQRLEFENPYYIGSYSASSSLQFDSVIRLAAGEDQSVVFDLEGVDAQWFGLNQSDNLVTLTLSSPIPAAVLANNQQLVFVVTAQSPGSAMARATVVISLLDEYPEGSNILGFDRVTYLGSIENNQADIPAITLIEGFTPEVVFTLHGELANHFRVSPQGAVATVTLQSTIPEESIPANRIIVLKIQAVAPQTITAHATIVIDAVSDGVATAVELIFAQTFYFGSYTAAGGISFPTPITLTQGYGSNVVFALEGDNSQWFGLSQNDNSVSVTLTSPIPAAVLANNQQLVFVVTAQSPGSAMARATVVISLLDEYPEGSNILGFDRVTYLGSIENNQADIPAITLIEGFTPGVVFTLHGELANHFSVSPQGAVATVILQSTIPEESIPANRIIVLKIQAVAPQTIAAHATIVIDAVSDGVATAVELIFAQTFYFGSYTAAGGISFPTPITLTQGYGSNVVFALEGDYSQWFGLSQNNNSVSVTLTSPIPAAVLANNQQLVFVVTAQSPGSAMARATVVISLLDEYPEGSNILGFDRVTYLGSIENNQADIPAITLIEGFTPEVVFTLHGELANHFSVSPQGAVATVTLQSTIPEESIPANRIIVLKIQAVAPQTITAHATIVIDAVSNGVATAVELIFAQTFYFGSYTAAGGISFPTPITLTQGYGSNVVFALEGDNSQWFGLSQNDNSVSVTLTSPIPAAVLANNQQLVFVVTAQSPGSAMARATVVISLLDEYPEGSNILGFDRVTYLGSIENNQADIPAITLIEGFTPGVVFTLHGEHANHFRVSPQGAVATVTLQSTIPEESIPANRIIVLKIQAVAPQTITAHATIVIDAVSDGVATAVELIFAQTFYFGSYTAAGGISFPTPITLTQGYGSNVVFALEGDYSQWFGLSQNNNSVSVTLTSPIPAAVLANNQQLVFVVTAQSPGSAMARVTVVISLLDEYPEGSNILGFDRVTYLGSIENNQADIPAITLIEGFTPEVVFTLHGELANHFSVSPQGAVATVTLQSTIPEESIPANRIIVLKIQAVAPQTITAHATIVIDAVSDGVATAVELIFAQTFYFGSYTAAGGISFPTPITLTQGYGSNVVFALEGDYSQWFGLSQNNNSVSVTLTSPIPAAVLANNQQLVFVVTAQSPGSAMARATVVISLLDEYPEGSNILGFDRVTYLGSIENNQADIPAITLIEGFTPEVVFTLHGELANHFSVSPQGAVATVTLQSTIPEESIPANRIIVLKIQAVAPQTITAHATIVIDAVSNGVATAVELIFAQTFYFGSYTAAGGISFPTPITLTQGYGSNVVFALEGDNSQWFGLSQNDNSVSVTLTSPIPAAVLANNQQLVFVVTAQSPGSAMARATVVISLLDEYPEGSNILGFDRVTYLGSIENNQADIPAITLIEGFTPGVVFTLHGEHANHFSVSPQGAVATVILQSTIPEESIPANRIIVLVIQAVAPQTITAHATIVIDVVSDGVATAVELIFAQTFYFGSYTAAGGISFPTPITLTQGYGSNVVFALEGDYSQWFGLSQNNNSVSVTLTSPIPAAVLANNQQLVFVVTAQSPGSAMARATVVISLLDEYPEGSNILGFDRVTYLGSIENNQADIPAITLIEGFTPGVVFTLHGELANHFSVSPQGAVATVILQSTIPEESIPANRIIVLKIQAVAPQTIAAHATIVIDAVSNGVATAVELIFAQTFYFGSYTAAGGISFPTPITLTQGYGSNVVFALEGDYSQWFGLSQNNNSVSVTLTSPIPAAVLANNQQLVFVVTAQSPGSAMARATVVISLLDEYPEGSNILGFDRVTYLGSIENNQADIPAITLIEGFTPEVVFTLHGELANHFSVSPQGAVATVTLQSTIPEESIPANRIIVLKIQAVAPQTITAHATIVIDAVSNGVATAVELIFAQTFYFGSYTAAGGISFPTPITLTQGYGSNVVFALEGDNSQWFGLSQNDNSVSVTLTSPIPAAVLANNQQLVFVVTAQSPGSAMARATVVISLLDDSQPESDVAFGKVLFEGIVQNGIVTHEIITIVGFSGSTVELHGEFSPLFASEFYDGVVTVTASGSLTLPSDVTHVALELRAASASAVLLLNVIHTDEPTIPPVVTFSSPSYAIQVEITQIGVVGQVRASADNGESVSYSLQLNNAHLQERLSINSEGELHFFAPANVGSYTFEVVATTIFTRVTGTATVHLTVEGLTMCGDEFVMPPLIVIDVDEEEPHYDLINGTQYENCQFTLSNRWPLDQTWLYVDESGLHTRAINREHESIAFMAVSQVRVEIILHCEGDTTRSKRSLYTSNSLGPYDYGTNKWILTDTILFNSRRSYVNVIVNDINDNAPIFVGKENEPIVVGYPVPELAERVLPRSLAELHATDADIGENAFLRYWSSEPELAVAPTTGFVHLRDGATLENNTRYTVHATDRNGEGLSGYIHILVRLLDENYIAVVTIRDAFLDDEETVISHLTESVGYEVRVLRSVVISDEVEEDEIDTRKKQHFRSAYGASLQLYVYGLIAREPVSVDRLTTDISNIIIGPVSVASSVSLQDHLEAQEICVTAGRDVALLVSTIVLSVLLFIILVLIAVWYFLRWRKNRNYDEFSDENSLASRNESVDKLPRPEVLPKPRLDIGELKKSERRLQERLDAPIDEILVEPASSRKEALLDLPLPEPNMPIVIQSIDKLKDAADESSEDEFGETRSPKRKSVVTFNENVEKIIHVEDTPDTEDISSDPGYEIYKL